MIGVCTTMPILLDATPLSKGDVKLGGAKLVGAHAFDVNCFMSLCTAKLILKSLKGLKKFRLHLEADTIPINNFLYTPNVISSQPRPIASISLHKIATLRAEPVDYTFGCRAQGGQVIQNYDIDVGSQQNEPEKSSKLKSA